MAASWSVDVMAPMATRIAPSLREPPAVSWDPARVQGVLRDLPSFIMISPKRSSRRLSEASTIRPSSTWICAVAASIDGDDPALLAVRDDGEELSKLRSRRAAYERHRVSLSSGGGDLILPGLLAA